MDTFVFRGSTECEDGIIFHLETKQFGFPVNVIAEKGSAQNLQDGETCTVQLYGTVSRVDIYQSKEALYADRCTLAVPSLVTVGMFPPEEGEESLEVFPISLIVGTVLEVDIINRDADNQPNCCVTVETLEMTVRLYLCYEGKIEVGNIVAAIVLLCGTVTRA